MTIGSARYSTRVNSGTVSRMLRAPFAARHREHARHFCRDEVNDSRRCGCFGLVSYPAFSIPKGASTMAYRLWRRWSLRIFAVLLTTVVVPGRFLAAQEDIRELKLRDWEPRSMLVTKTTIVET